MQVLEIAEGVEVVEELPVIYLRKHKTLVFADTHIGFEEEMASQGIYVPSFQLMKVMDILEKALEARDVSKVVIAGDFKHIFSGLGDSERRELSKIITYLLPQVDDLIVVRGNHDNYLPILQRKFPFEIVDHYLVGNILIIHGHKPIPDVEGWDTLIFGHEHPSIVIRDSLGTVGKYSCFLRGRLKNGKYFITLPAVGAYQTGSRVTLSRDTYISPILRDYAVLEEIEPVIVDDEVGLLELPKLRELADLI